jgi:hypothetical protein
MVVVLAAVSLTRLSSATVSGSGNGHYRTQGAEGWRGRVVRRGETCQVAKSLLKPRHDLPNAYLLLGLSRRTSP